ncbi:MAG: NADH-quinone oxidoreductase subunit C [Candidatus Hecatellales archaeon ex4484_218]|nr:MAG: NADH-quinone oxidoreductase subunit C [Candidatus Hecatellales archaeon ex4484_218]
MIKVEEEVVETLKQTFTEYVVEAKVQREKRVTVVVKRERLVEIARFLRDNLQFDHIASVSGVDYPEKNEFMVVYHVWSIPKKVLVALKTSVPRDNPHLSSLISVWEGVNYFERETWEMFGIIFDGHPNLSRFLLPEDWDRGFPFRKDFKLRTKPE